MKVNLKDIEFTKCEEYNSIHPKANSLGMRKFWRADYCGVTVATLCDTKAECVQKAKMYLKSRNM